MPVRIGWLQDPVRRQDRGNSPALRIVAPRLRVGRREGECEAEDGKTDRSHGFGSVVCDVSKRPSPGLVRHSAPIVTSQ